MTSDILAFFTPGPLELIIIFFIGFAIPAVVIVLVVVYVLKGSKEKNKLHQQIDELSGELKQTQEQLQSQKKDESSV